MEESLFEEVENKNDDKGIKIDYGAYCFANPGIEKKSEEKSEEIDYGTIYFSNMSGLVEDEIAEETGGEIEDVSDFTGFLRQKPVWTSLSWEAFLEGFKSANRYSQRIADFKAYYEMHNFGCLHEGLLQYFILKNGEVDESGEPRNCPTTMRGWFSAFKAFFRFTNQGDLCKDLPILEAKFKQWSKEYMIKKSRVFTEADLGKNNILLILC
jgi:hypothetical protein